MGPLKGVTLYDARVAAGIVITDLCGLLAEASIALLSNPSEGVSASITRIAEQIEEEWNNYAANYATRVQTLEYEAKVLLASSHHGS